MNKFNGAKMISTFTKAARLLETISNLLSILSVLLIILKVVALFKNQKANE